MSNFANNGVLVQEYIYDFSVDGGVYTSAFDLSAKNGYQTLPTGALVFDVYFNVVTAVVGSSSTVKVGNGTDDDGYVESIAEATLVAGYAGGSQKNKGALVFDDTADCNIPNRVTATATTGRFILTVGTANLTAGKIVYHALYLMPSAV